MAKNSSFKVKLGIRSPNDLPEKGALSYDPETHLPTMGDGEKWVPIERTRATVGARLTNPVVEPLTGNVPEVLRFYDVVSYQVLDDFQLNPSVGTEILASETMVFDALTELEISSSKNDTIFTIYTYLGPTLISTRILHCTTKNLPVSFVGIGPIIVTTAAPLRMEIEADKNIDLTIHSATVILTRQPD